jgi:hypothetical protein
VEITDSFIFSEQFAFSEIEEREVAADAERTGSRGYTTLGISVVA